MKPKGKENLDGEDEVGLLEYLEDLIGSDKFKASIKEKELKYEEMFSAKRDKGELVKIAEGNLEKLDNSKNMAIKYFNIEKENF